MSKLPEGWKIIKLEDISKITMGQSPKSDTYNEDKIGIPLIQGNADCKNRKTIPRIYTTELTKECSVSDIIMTVRAPVGAITKSYHNACIGRGVCAIKPKEKNEYLYHYLVFYEDKWDKLSQGSTFTAVSGSDIKNFQIPLPSLPEQKKIANILSTVDEKIALIDNQIEETETLKKGLMQKLLTEGIGHGEFKDSEIGRIPVGWGVVKLETLATKISDGIHMTPKYVNNSQYNFINGNNLSNGEITFNENTKCVSREEYLKYKKELNDNTVLLSINGTIGNVAYYNNEEIVLGKSAAYIICTDKLNKFYLGSLLKSFLIKRYFDLELTGTTIRNLSIKSIKNIKVPFPPLKEQTQIAEILSTTDEKLEILRDKKESFQKLKKGRRNCLVGKFG